MKTPLGTGLGPAAILAALLLPVTASPAASQMEVQCDRKDASTWRSQPTVDVLVYQGPCNPKLVPGRRSMVRVFLNWKDHEGKKAPPDYHVTATLSGESGPVACKVTPNFPVQVIKQRLYANSQRAKAQNSLNFFGCDLDGVGTLTAKVAFRERPDHPIHQPRRIAHMSRAEVVRARVVFPTVGSWSGGVPAAAITEARKTLSTGAAFAIKNLPIYDVAWSIAGDPVLKIQEPHLDPAVDLDWSESDEDWSVETATCESLPAETCRTFVEADPIDDDELAPEDWLYDVLSGSNDHLVVAVVPNDFQGGWSGLTRRPRGNLCLPVSANTLDVRCRTPAVILFRMDMSIETVAHEVGHYLGLPHHQGTLQGGSTREIEGFLASSTAGLNKSFLEGNGDPVASGTLISLMAAGKQNPATAPASHFIMNAQYQALQEDLEETPLATTAGAPVAEGAVRLAWADAPATGSLGLGAPPTASFGGALVPWAGARPPARATAPVLVRGRVHRDGRSARLGPLAWTPFPHRSVGKEASSAIRFLDAQGALLTAVPVDLGAVVESSHATVPSSSTGFAVLAEVPENATTLQLAASDGSILAELVRPEGAGPTVALMSPEREGTWTPDDPIRWRVEGSEAPVSVYYSPDGGSGWTPLLLGGAGTSLDVSGLDPGPEPMIVVATSDGWNVAADTVRFSVRTDPEPLDRSPAPGDVVGVGAEISLSFNTDLDAEVLGRAFRLTDGEGEAVDGDSSWSEGARMLRYRPASPLAHGGEYTVTIADGLEDRYGNRSRSEYEWSFRVEPDVDAPRIAGVFPRDGALAIPVTPSITVGFTEAMDPGTLDGIQVLDSDGQPVEISTTWDEESRTALLSPGSPLEGSADYRVTVSAVRDLAGNALEAPSEWSFSTVATPGEGPAVGMASEGDAPRDGRPVGMAGTPDAAAWDGVALAGPELVLDFLENAGGDLTSSPQRVRGEGSATGLTARGGFDLGMSLSPARTAVCGFSQSVAMGLQMLAGGRTVDGDVRLSGGPEGVEVALEFDQGTIAARTESPGQVTLIAPEPGTVRVEVRAATLELRLDQGDFSCPGLMNFGFTLSDAR